VSRRQLTSFAIVGAFGFLIDAGVLYLLYLLVSGLYPGRAISFLCAIFVTWQMNRRTTFPSERPRSLSTEWWRYLSGMALGGLINFLVYAAVLHITPDNQWKPLLGVAVGPGIALFFNFSISKWWIFSQRS
jgi:putative flippase GtrA